jgi:Protein of unknown function (DUF2490)
MLLGVNNLHRVTQHLFRRMKAFQIMNDCLEKKSNQTWMQLIIATVMAGISWGGNAQAQQAKPAGVAPGTVEQFQLWTQFSVIRNITPGMRGVVEITPRFRTRETTQTPATFALSPTGFALDRFVSSLWLVFPLNQSNTIRAGVRTFLNTPTQTRSFGETETRFAQDYISAYPLGDVILGTRFRLEERLLPNRQSPSIRVTTRLGLEIPLDQQRKWWFLIADEFFLNLNNGGSPNLRPGLTENRASAGIRSRLAPGIVLDFLYQNTWNNRDTAFDDLYHALVINVSFDIDQIEKANALQIEREKAQQAVKDQPPIKLANLPQIIAERPIDPAAITTKTELLAKSNSIAVDLMKPAFSEAPMKLPNGKSLITQNTAELKEVEVVASREKQLNEYLSLSMLMNGFDSVEADGSP